MAFFDYIYSFFSRMGLKQFYRYALITLLSIMLLISIIVFHYYRKANTLLHRINEINELREEARTIKEQVQHVHMKRAEANTMLAEDKDFKIGGYFDELLQKLNLSNKKSSEETSQIDREDEYRETELTARLIDVSMKQLTELLQQIEQTRRVYIKKLGITKSNKNSSLEIEIIIATLLLKAE